MQWQQVFWTRTTVTWTHPPLGISTFFHRSSAVAAIIHACYAYIIACICILIHFIAYQARLRIAIHLYTADAISIIINDYRLSMIRSDCIFGRPVTVNDCIKMRNYDFNIEYTHQPFSPNNRHIEWLPSDTSISSLFNHRCNWIQRKKFIKFFHRPCSVLLFIHSARTLPGTRSIWHIDKYC